MTIDSREVIGNGPERNFVKCPFCGQKMLNVTTLGGEMEVVVKCRRCHRFIKIHMVP